MHRLYVVGGHQKNRSDGNEDWHLYEKGMILGVDQNTGDAEICVEHVTPSEACAFENDPSIVFKAGTVREDKLYACTQTEVLIYQLPYFTQLNYVSLPCFNDVHHVSPTLEDKVLVAVTGLDMVIEMTQQGNILREWDVLGEEPWQRFSRSIDYRKVVTTKPHMSHPNYVFQSCDDIWVTRFEQKDAICLNQPYRRIGINIERPHDGIVHEGFVYYTTVNGYIVVAELQTQQIVQVVNLNEIVNTGDYYSLRPLGWCRGLHVVDRDYVIVGFTHLRATKWRENVRWAKRQVGIPAGQMPTRIALYDIKHRKLCWEHNLEEYGMDAIFSIHSWEK